VADRNALEGDRGSKRRGDRDRPLPAARTDLGGGLLIQLIALVLLIESVLHIITKLRLPREEADPYVMLQAGVGDTLPSS
jgi:hypothetical protein